MHFATIEPSFGHTAAVAALSTASLVLIPAWIWRAKLADWLRRHPAMRDACGWAELLVATAAGALAGIHKLYAKETWKEPQPDLTQICVAMGFLISLGLVAKVLPAKAKERDGDRIKELEKELAGLKDQLQTKEGEARRNDAVIERLTKIQGYVGQLVEQKMKRILKKFQSCKSRSGFNTTKFSKALNPRDQLVVIMNVIHHFFESDLKKAGGKLRLGIYTRDPNDRNALKVAYSYDGERTKDVFSNNKEHMRLDLVGRQPGLIIHAARTNDALHVVSSCASEPNFQYFHPKQQTYLKSLLVYRRASKNAEGEDDLMILSLDTDQDGFFGRYPKEQLNVFLSEMIKRVEFELMAEEIYRTVTRPQKGCTHNGQNTTP